jgi:hypothetical protein
MTFFGHPTGRISDGDFMGKFPSFVSAPRPRRLTRLTCS